MGVDTVGNLIDAEPRDIAKALISMGFEDAKVRISPNVDFFFAEIIFTGEKQTRMMSVQPPRGDRDRTRVSLGHDAEARKVIGGLVKIFGGSYIERDDEGRETTFRGEFSNEDGLIFMVRYGILNGTMKNSHDLPGLVRTVEKWGKDMRELNKFSSSQVKVIPEEDGE